MKPNLDAKETLRVSRVKREAKKEEDQLAL